MMNQEGLYELIRIFELKNSKLETQNELHAKEIETLNDLLKNFEKKKIEELIRKNKESIDCNKERIKKNSETLIGLNQQKNWKIFHLLKLVDLPNLNFGEKLSSTATEVSTMHPNALYEWPEFEKNLNLFGESMCTDDSKFSKKKYEPYFFNRNVNILSHDDVVFQMLTICNEIFTKRILSDDSNAYFNTCPNKMQVKGDIYYKDNFFIEIKTPKTLPINSTLTNDYKLGLNPSKKAISQIYGYMRRGKIKYSLLSTYNDTWLLFNTNEILFISPSIPKNKLILTIFYALTLRDKSIHEETQRLHFDKIIEHGEKLQLNLNINDDCPFSDVHIVEKNLDLNDYFIIEDFEKEFTNLDSIKSNVFDSMISGEIIGYGASGIVLKVKISNKSYALKMIDLDKEFHLLPELKNEISILKYLNSKNVKRVPKIYFSGEIGGQYCLLMSFLEGNIKEFENMNQNEKKSCVECVDELHKNSCLHDDIRHTNFIISNEIAYVIDFGRSKLLDVSNESFLCKEKNELLKYIQI